MIEQLQARIDKLNDVGQHAFNGSDYSFGFNTWSSGTITLLRRLFPEENELIEQIQNIYLHRVNMHATDASAYNLEACKNEASEILQIFIQTLNQSNNSVERENNKNFWSLLHPKVMQLAKPLFDIGSYADAISSCLREINTIIKNHVNNAINQELDGSSLMTRAFSINDPIIELADVTTMNGRNIQLGYMKIFEGAMIGIRNPKAHANLHPDKNLSIHFLFIASFMFIKLQEAGLLNEE